MLETIARSALCLHCTNFLRQYCTADFFPDLDQLQSEDQAGFRSSYQTTDHLTTYRMIEQRCHEWGVKMWVATLDFMKAFDSITHNSVWDALKCCGIEHEYINLLKRLQKPKRYCNDGRRKPHVRGMKKGTKQGDQLSSLLFDTVLQLALKDDLPRWQKKRGMGICFGDSDNDCLTTCLLLQKEQPAQKRWDSRYIHDGEYGRLFSSSCRRPRGGRDAQRT